MKNNISDVIIGLCATGGKIAIDSTKLPFWGKEGCKLGVDIAAKVLKEAFGAERETLVDAARSCKIEKVVAISLLPFLPSAQPLMLLRAYGGDPVAFFSKMGFFPLTENDTSKICGDIAKAEKEYGIVLYERT